MSLQEIKDITRQLGPGWKCGAIVHPPGGRCKLHLGPEGVYDPFSQLLVIEMPFKRAAIEIAIYLTNQTEPHQLIASTPGLTVSMETDTREKGYPDTSLLHIAARGGQGRLRIFAYPCVVKSSA